MPPISRYNIGVSLDLLVFIHILFYNIFYILFLPSHFPYPNPRCGGLQKAVEAIDIH
jgi:hypothetical protein